MTTSIAMHQGYDFMPMRIRWFEAQISNIKPMKFVRFDITTATRLKRHALIDCSNVNREDHPDGFDGTEDHLLGIKFITNADLKKNVLDDASKAYSYKPGEAIYLSPLINCQHIAGCSCNEFKRSIKGNIIDWMQQNVGHK